ncbi:MAG: hydroxymethylbilane synthase, partial [Vulcanimicrobiaceae bacterium]
LEQALADRRADYAVHSAKDLPSSLSAEFSLAAISRREDPRDAFCSERYAGFAALPIGARIGTSSPRRVAQLRHRRPDLVFCDIRGNIDTRLRKLRDGEFDAIVLAMAGLRRLGISATHTHAFAVDDLVPAVGQGALAIEIRSDDAALQRELFAAVNDRDTALAVTCERAALAELQAGCNAPIGIHAVVTESTAHVSASALTAHDTIVRLQSDHEVHTLEDARAVGVRIAQDLILARNG